jgi:hypothetical protein
MNKCSESTNRQLTIESATKASRQRLNQNASQLQITKKGNTRIRKPFDASLSDSYLEPKLTLFISRAILIHYHSQYLFITICSTHSSPFAALIHHYSQHSSIPTRSESTTESENGLSTGVVRVKDATTVVNKRVTRV